jgi:hypothetical protein
MNEEEYRSRCLGISCVRETLEVRERERERGGGSYTTRSLTICIP